MRHARAVMYVGIGNPLWWGKKLSAFPLHAQPTMLRIRQEAHIGGLFQDCSISGALALEVTQSRTKSLLCTFGLFRAPAYVLFQYLRLACFKMYRILWILILSKSP